MGISCLCPTETSSWLNLSNAGQPCQEDEAGGFSTWEQRGHALNGENVAPTLEPHHPVSTRVFKSTSPRRSAPQDQVGYSQLSPLQEQAQQDGDTMIWENRSRKPSIRGDVNFTPFLSSVLMPA